MSNITPPDESNIKAKEDEGFLSFRNSIRTYGETEIDAIFEDMKGTLLADKVEKIKKGEKTEEKVAAEVVRDFSAAAAGVGTHTPRLHRTTAAMPTVTFTPPGRNQPGKSFYAGNAAVGKFVKVIKRPISIEGQGHEKSFFDRLIEGDEHIDALKASFAKAFGPEALNAVIDAIAARHERHVGASIHHENIPVIFIPGPDGDLQASMLSNIESYDLMNNMRIEAWRDYRRRKEARVVASKAGEEGGENDASEGLMRIVPWIFSSSEVSGKIRNAALNVFETRVRFRARMPEALSRLDGEIWAFAEKDGRFPRFRDTSIVEALDFYAERHAKHMAKDAHVTPAMKAKLDEVADRLIDAATAWRNEVAAEMKVKGYDRDVSVSALEILRSLPLAKRNRADLFGVLVSPHFAARLSLKGEA